MRFFAPILALFAATTVAQSQFNQISNGQSTLTPSAGEAQTITWENPSSGTVTIKIQPADPAAITPDSGTTLLENVDASSLSASVTIPADAVIEGQRYVFQIIDDTNTNGRDNANYSFPFQVSGAEGSASTTATGTASETTLTTQTSTSDDASSTITESESSTATDSTATESTGTATPTSRRNTSSSSRASETLAPTTAPGSGSKLAAQGGLFAVMFGAVVAAM